jgi:hypothetical protein
LSPIQKETVSNKSSFKNIFGGDNKILKEIDAKPIIVNEPQFSEEKSED